MTANDRGKTLSSKQQNAIVSLLSTSSIAKAAALSGIAERTLRRWLAQAHFRENLEQARQQVTRDGLDQLRATLTGAVQRLAGLQDSANEHVALGACRVLLDFGFRAVEIIHIEERLRRLETMPPSACERGELCAPMRIV